MEVCFYPILVLFAVTSSCSEDTSTTEEDWNPYFGETMSNVTAPLGREAVFSCVVQNLGNYKVGWIRAEDQTVLSLDTRVVTHNPRISVSQLPERGVWKLHIRQLRHSDRGCYMCQINTFKMKKQIACLDVHVPPDILDSESSSDIRLVEGDNVTLSCRATGRPHPRIVWKREDGQPILAFVPNRGFISDDTWNGEVLHLVHVNYMQAGAYLCIASNDIPPAVSKRIIVVVYFAPVAQSPLDRRLGATLGSTVSISCLFHGLPNLNTSWHREIGRIQEYGGDYTINDQRESYEVRLDLTIRNLRPIDFGKYFCSLVNEWGFARSTIYLYEIRNDVRTTSVPQRIRMPKVRTRITSTRKLTTTQLIPIYPTFSDETENEIAELAVEAERRWGGTSSSWILSTTLPLQVFSLLHFLR